MEATTVTTFAGTPAIIASGTDTKEAPTAYLEGDNWDFNISEWWDSEGEYHEGMPTEDELLDASQLTGHYTDADGNDKHMTFLSEDGWTYEELDGEFQEWYQEGTE